MSILRTKNGLYTENLVPGKSVYGEEIIEKDGKEMRYWDPNRSKLSAALMNGLKQMPIEEGSKILYLGASTGTTCSHVSDIIGHNGIIYALEFSERVFRSLLELSKTRKNIAPIFADVRKIEDYYWVEEVDVVFCDIAQPDETEIAIRNADKFLKDKGFLMLSIKSQSIDVTKKPEKVYKEESEKLKKNGFDVLELINLEPHEKAHGFILARR